MNKIVQKNRKKIEKRPIAPTLKLMQANEIQVFPIVQMDTVRAGITRIQTYNRSLKFSTKTENDTIIVTRTS